MAITVFSRDKKRRTPQRGGEEVPTRSSAPSHADGLVSLQRSAGNRAATYAVQRDGKGQVLLSDEQLLDTFTSWLNALQASRGYGMTQQIWSEALARTEHQVGPVNFERLISSGLVSRTWKPITDEEVAAAEAEAREEEAIAEALTPAGMLKAASAQFLKLRNAANKLSSAVAQTEHLAHKLKSPEGLKGDAYEATAGALGLMAASVNAYTDIKPALDPLGIVTDKTVDAALDAAAGKDESKKKPTIGDKAEKWAATVGTSKEIAAGRLHELWKKTRPSYNSFVGAQKGFQSAAADFSNAGDALDAFGKLEVMRSRLQAMSDAAHQYLNTCTSLGIEAKAGALGALNKAIVDAHKAAVTEATSLLMGGIGPLDDASKALSDRASNKLKGKVSDKVADAVAEQAVGKATGVATGMPKKALEKAIELEDKK